jgi:nucleoside-diphosphate-sugar epimerase
VSERQPPTRGGFADREGLCLVTGASGFIGGLLAERLAGLGHRVRCLVRASSDTSKLVALDVELALGDLADRDSLVRAAEDCRYVLHCGALVSDWATKTEIARANVTGTRNALDAAVAASAERFVHFSTTDVYGHPGGVSIEETHTAARFANWYAQTKLEAEAEVLSAHATGAIDVVVLRPASVYGPGSTEVVGEIARALVAGHMLLVNRGRAIAGLCYVENVIDAALLALSSGAAAGCAFNVTDGLDVSWKRFTDDLAAGLGCRGARLSLPFGVASAIGFSLEHAYRALRAGTGASVPPLLSRQAVQVLGVDQDFSNRRAREALGWEPRVSYAAGLEATLAWLRASFATC